MTLTEPALPVRILRGVPVVTAPTEIDITNAAQRGTALLRATARPGTDLVIDMTRTRFCDSAGLHALLGAHRRARAEGRHVKLAVTGAQVRRLLALMALGRLIPSTPAWTRPLTARPRQMKGGSGPSKTAGHRRRHPPWLRCSSRG